MSRSWNHRIWRLSDDAVDENDRFGRECSTGKCQGLPTHRTRWDYTTGRAGRTTYTDRSACTRHGELFAAKHNLTIGDNPPVQQNAFSSALAAMTGGGPVHRVGVYPLRGGSWYKREFQSRPGMLGHSDGWMSGVRAGATLDEAIAEAELLLARRQCLVPVDDWTREGSRAIVDVIPAQRHDSWFGKPWLVTVACNAEGMWGLTCELAPHLAPVKRDLGNHNMTRERALAAAVGILDHGGWVRCSTRWDIYDDDGPATQHAWHVDQANPDRWRAPAAAGTQPNG